MSQSENWTLACPGLYVLLTSMVLKLALSTASNEALCCNSSSSDDSPPLTKSREVDSVLFLTSGTEACALELLEVIFGCNENNPDLSLVMNNAGMARSIGRLPGDVVFRDCLSSTKCNAKFSRCI